MNETKDYKKIRGVVSVGVAHPLYGKEVDLYVLHENTGYDGRQTSVRTVDEYTIPTTLFYFNKRGKIIREEPSAVTEHVEGWLVGGTRKEITEA